MTDSSLAGDNPFLAPSDNPFLKKPGAGALDLPRPDIPTSTIGNIARSAKGAAESGLGQTLGGFADVGDKLTAAAGASPEDVQAGQAKIKALTGLDIPMPQALAKSVEDRGAEVSASTSPEFQEATSKGILDPGGFTPTNIASKAVNTVASMAAPTVAAFTPGIGPAVGVAAFGAQGERAAREEETARITAMSDQDLAAIPRYKELLDSGMSPEDARAAFSNEAANRSATVGGAFGAGLGVLGKVPGVKQAGDAIGSGLSKLVRPSIAKTVGAGAAEGLGFGGINAAGQAVSNVSNEVPTAPGEGVLESAVSGLLPGVAMGVGHHVLPLLLARPHVKFPDAQPGSLSEAANINEAVHTAEAPDANAPNHAADEAPAREAPSRPGESAPHGSLSDAAATVPAPDVPWIDKDTGAFTPPTDSQIKDQFHALFDRAIAAGGATPATTRASKGLAEDWGVPFDHLKAMRTAAILERRAGFKTGDIRPEDAQAATAALQSEADATQQPGAVPGQASTPENQSVAAEKTPTAEAAAPQTPDTPSSSDQGADTTKAVDEATPSGDSTTKPLLQQYSDRQTQIDELNAKRKAGNLSTDESNQLHDLRDEQDRVNPVSGLPNRKAFDEAAASGDYPHKVAIDIDEFKRVNDTLGHNVGDLLLQHLGQHLANESSGDVKFFHNSGDEYAALSKTDPTERMAKVQSDLDKQPITLSYLDSDGKQVQHQFNGIGVTFGAGKDLQAADHAANQSKTQRADQGLRRRRTDQPDAPPGRLVQPAEGSDLVGRDAGAGAAEPERSNAAVPGATDAGKSDAGVTGDESRVASDVAAEQGAKPAVKPESGSVPGADDAGANSAAAKPAKPVRKAVEKSEVEKPTEAPAADKATTKVKTSVGTKNVSRAFDVPLLGSSGKDGTVYINKGWDPVVKDGLLKGLDRTPLLVEHEAVEAAKEKQGVNYSKAHYDHAEPAEHALLLKTLKLKAGTDEANKAIEAYEQSYKQDLVDAAKTKNPAIPPDLLEKPYEHPHNVEQRKLLAEVDKGEPTIDEAAKTAATHPDAEVPATPAQQEAGNHKMGHVDVHGMDVTIEVPKGGMRKGTTKAGVPWERAASDHYGYIKRTEAADGEQVDVYLGPHAEDPDAKVFVIDQVKPGTKQYDESKAMIGFKTGQDARKSYAANFPKGMKVFGGIKQMSIDEFKEWAKSGDAKKPAANPFLVPRAETKPATKSAEPSASTQSSSDSSATKAETKKQSAARARADLAKLVRDNGSSVDAASVEQAWKNGDRVFGFHEQDEDVPIELKTLASFKAYDPEQMRVVPGGNDEATAQRREERLNDELSQGKEDLPVAAAAPSKAEAKPAATGAITDVGEKIGGARKDMWRSHDMRREELADLNERELAEFVKKDAVFKRPDYADLVKNVGRDTAYGVKLVYDGIPNPGDKLTRAQFEDYVTAVGKVRDALATVKSKDDLKGLMQKAFGDDIMTGSGYMRRFNRESPNYPLVRLLGNKMSRTLQEAGFNDSTVTRKLAKSAWPEKTEGKVAADGKLKPEPREKLASVQRTGNDYRGGKDVGAEHFKDTFGFRGVEFGNWTDQGDRQASLNHAFDGLHDLADALRIPPKAVSLNGQLGLAFGARGKGSASAHYEPTRAVINLTKTSGAGSVAHEWAHAVDDYFGKLSGDAKLKGRDWAVTDALVKRYGIQSGVGELRPELVKAISNVMRSINERARTPDEAAKSANDALGKIDKVLPRLGETLKDGMGEKYDEKTKTLFDAAAAGSGDVGEQMAELGRHVEATAGKKSIANETVERIRRQLLNRDSFTKALRQAIDKPDSEFGKVGTDYVEKSRALGPYWARPHELFARAFESFIHDKIVGEGNRSDYLTHPSNRDAGATNPRFPYPAAGERKTINGAFDQFVDALQHKETEGGKVALFDRGARTTGDTKASELRAAITEATKNWGDNAPRVRIVDSPDQLPAAAKRQAGFERARGYYDGDTAYVVADKHGDAESALRTLAHEAVGHHGIENILNDHVKGGWDQLAGDIDRLRTQGLGSEKMRAVLADVDKRYPGADKSTFAKETLAVMAERGIKNGLLSRAVAAIKAFVRKLLPNMKFGEVDLARMLGKSEDFLNDTASQSARQEAVGSMAFDKAAATDSAEFKKFFAGSKVVDAKGEPATMFHGTGADFSVFGKDKAGEATGHATAPLGHFFTDDRARAERYAENASEGVPADQRVVDAYLSVKKPYEMSLKEAQAIDNPDEARTLRAKLEKQGFDGVHIAEADSWVAFHPEQIKSASANRGTFDTKNPDIHFSMEPPKEDDFKEPRATVDNLSKVLAQPDTGVLAAAKQWATGKLQDFKPKMLGALQLRHVLELMEDHAPLKGASQYKELEQRMSSDRLSLMTGDAERAKENPKDMLAKGASNIAEDWRKFAYEKGPAGWLGKQKPEAKLLSSLMHDATRFGLDPEREYQKLSMQDSRGDSMEWSKDAIKDRIKEIRGQMRGRPGDDKTLMMEEVKRLRGLPARENLRRDRWPDLVARWQALPDAAKETYRNTRDWYQQNSDATEKALIQRIEALDTPDQYKRSITDRIRQQFESNRRDGVYFPLQRFGEFWASLQDARGEPAFLMFESAKEYEQAERKLRAAGYTIDAHGRKDGTYKAKDAPPGTFVADIIAQLKKAGAPEKVQDDIYQSYLKTLPELSMRRHNIHRKNIAGYSEDALRVFAKNSFHSAHQLARLRYGYQMSAVVDGMQMSLDNFRKGDELGGATSSDARDVASADALMGELKRRHDWIMSPKDTNAANIANSIGFMYYLGASPSSAVVFLTQNLQMTLPAMGAKHGWGKAAPALASAMRDAIRTGGNIDRKLTNEEEKRAYQVFKSRGDITKTQAHSLAGLSEGNRLQSTPAWSKVMNGMAFFMHKADMINRGAAGMAAFRLARRAGETFDNAVQYGSEMINGTHGDYSNANRARFMQGSVGKVLFQFKNYALMMAWNTYRNLYQSFKGETPEVRQLARRTFTGMMGMAGLLSGSMGLPFYGIARSVGNIYHEALGDENEPWDFDTEFRGWLKDHLGDTAGTIAASGAANQALGFDLGSRIGLSDEWFRQPDHELEGKDAYYNLLDSIAGPMGSMVKNWFVGNKMIADGNMERGVETMMPKPIKDAMKATRFAKEGANTLSGAPLVDDVTTREQISQLFGFTPTRLQEQYQENASLKNYSQQIQTKRTSLLNGFAMAMRTGDEDLRAGVLERIQAFNKANPEIAISTQSLRNSVVNSAKALAETQHGVRLNKKVNNAVREAVGAPNAP